ncbi:MAG: phage portal protein [Acidobacteria bacterium]|nr:phage portal protein [Acidobacteriota bacterium]
MADGYSADAAASSVVRRTLRNRARYEVANNGYAAGIIQTLANDVIGTGPRLQMLTDSDDTNRLIELEFAAWAKRIDLPGKLRTMRMAKAHDGEVFALFGDNTALTGPVKLDLRLLEADQVATPDFTGMDANAVDGIVLDAFGNPKTYHVLTDHPGATGALGASQKTDIDASQMIHWFRVDRPGQHRGVSEIASTLGLYAQLRDFVDSVIAAAKTAADHALVMKTTLLPDEAAAAEIEPFAELEISPNSGVFCPEGWEPFQLKAEQPSTTTPQFVQFIINQAARPWSMPKNIALCDSSEYNYASGRLDHQTYYKAIRVEQAQCESFVLDRIFDAWMAAARDVIGAPIGQWPHQWFWDGWEHIDPLKEANAEDIRLKNRSTNHAATYARRGQDWEEEVYQSLFEDARKEQMWADIRKSLSLPPAPLPGPTGQPAQAPAEVPDEKEATQETDDE